MNIRTSFIAVLATAGGFAAFASAAENGLKITMIKPAFNLGEVVQYDVKKTTDVQLPLKTAKRTIQQQVGATWKVVKTYAQGEKWEQAAHSINKGNTVRCEWNQKDDAGNQVQPGPYRVQLETNDGALTEKFTIRSTSAGDVAVTTEKDSYAQGKIIEFKLANKGAATINLDGARGVIYKVRQGTNTEFYSMPAPGFLGGQLMPNKYKTWKWDQWDNEHQTKAPAGKYLAKVWLPSVRKDAYQCEFKIE